jgi:hypothetical protein
LQIRQYGVAAAAPGRELAEELVNTARCEIAEGSDGGDDDGLGGGVEGGAEEVVVDGCCDELLEVAGGFQIEALAEGGVA